MKKLLIFLILVSCGIIAFLFLGKDTLNTTFQTETEKQVPEVSSETDLEPMDEEKPTPPQTSDNPSALTNQKSLQPPSAPGRSPIETEVEPEEPPVISESPVTSESPAEELEQEELEQDESEEVEEDNNEESNADSYPIEDAEIYFVPPEQRYPGNLGGPPPLNLPDQDFPEEQEAPPAPGIPE